MTADDWTIISLQGLLHVEDDIEDEFEIDINEQEPAFLKGQSTKNGGEVSPVKIVANPDGSLQVLLIPKRLGALSHKICCALCVHACPLTQLHNTDFALRCVYMWAPAANQISPTLLDSVWSLQTACC